MNTMPTAAPIQPSLFDLANRLHSDGTIAMSNIAFGAIPAGSRSQKLPGKVSRYHIEVLVFLWLVLIVYFVSTYLKCIR